MFSNKILIQAIDYQKTLFDNSYSAAAALQEQGNRLMDTALKNTAALPDGSKKVCSYWMDFVKQNQENYKAYVDTGFDKARAFFETASPAPAKKAAVRTAAKAK